MTKIILLILILFSSYLFLIENNQTISIIIPTFNRENLIIRSIASALNQTYTNIEVMIIDDGSIDDTQNKVKLIQDDRIRYIKFRKHKGGNYARNVGITKAKGRYISFLDSDDVFYSYKLEKQMNNMISKKSDLDFCKIEVYKAGKFKRFVPNQDIEQKFTKFGFFEELCNGNFISTQSILIKKKIIKQFMFNVKMPRLQDFELLLRMIKYIKVSYTNESLVKVYTQKNSISKKRNSLIKAIGLMSSNNYNLNKVQKQKLLLYFNKILKKKN
jgi:glycosyltransferase involved in cell wall biosynthesis